MRSLDISWFTIRNAALPPGVPVQPSVPTNGTPLGNSPGRGAELRWTDEARSRRERRSHGPSPALSSAQRFSGSCDRKSLHELGCGTERRLNHGVDSTAGRPILGCSRRRHPHRNQGRLVRHSRRYFTRSSEGICAGRPPATGRDATGAGVLVSAIMRVLQMTPGPARQVRFYSLLSQGS